MFGDYFKNKFPQDERNGLYAVPKLPAKKLGKALIKETRISSPNDVMAIHVNEGTFSSTMVIFTKERCFYDGGAFELEDIQEVQVSGKNMTVFASQKGQFVPHTFSVKNEQVATTLRKVLEGISSYDPKAQEALDNVYEGFSGTELDWLNLRDEIMRTIDMLYDRYNDGKLSMLQYEEKKEQLLSRL